MTKQKMDCDAVTDVGRQRARNEDHFLVADLVKAVRIHSTSLSYDAQAEVSGQSHGKVLVVADGMGGHAAGRRASTLAVDETINFMVNRMQWYAFCRRNGFQDADPQLLGEDLVTALKECQRRIRREATWSPGKQGMGTTLTIALVDWPQFHVVHAGDSRCYRFHKNKLTQLTRDHTLAQVFVDAGQISPEAAAESRLNHALWNVVGGPSKELVPEVQHGELAIGDTLLLCTDGLTRHLSDDAIASVLRKQQSAEEACRELVQRANNAGGADNITVAAARFLDVAEAPPQQKAEAKPTASAFDTTLDFPSPLGPADEHAPCRSHGAAAETRPT